MKQCYLAPYGIQRNNPNVLARIVLLVVSKVKLHLQGQGFNEMYFQVYFGRTSGCTASGNSTVES